MAIARLTSAVRKASSGLACGLATIMLVAPKLDTIDDRWIDELLAVLDRSLKRFEPAVARNGRTGA